MKTIAFLIIGFCLFSQQGCRANYYKIETTYSNPEAAGEERKIEATIEGRGTMKQITNVYQKIFKFVNDELMYKRK